MDERQDAKIYGRMQRYVRCGTPHRHYNALIECHSCEIQTIRHHYEKDGQAADNASKELEASSEKSRR